MRISSILLILGLLFVNLPLSMSQSNPCLSSCCEENESFFEYQVGLPPSVNFQSPGYYEITGPSVVIEEGCADPNSVQFMAGVAEIGYTAGSGPGGQVPVFTEGERYCIQFCMRVFSEIGDASIVVSIDGTDIYTSPPHTLADGWVSITAPQYTATSDGLDIKIRAQGSQPEMIVAIDNVCFGQVEGEPCKADFITSSNDACGEYCFESTSCGENLFYVWDIITSSGIIHTANTKDLCYTFTGPGPYTVRHTIFGTDCDNIFKEETIFPEITPLEVNCETGASVLIPATEECSYVHDLSGTIITGGIGSVTTTVYVNGIQQPFGSTTVVLGAGVHTITLIIEDACSTIECEYEITVECEMDITCQGPCFDYNEEGSSSTWTRYNDLSGSIRRDPVGLGNRGPGDTYLFGQDVSGFTFIYNDTDFAGDWTEWKECCLCFDYKYVDDKGTNTIARPYIMVYSGPAENPTLAAIYSSNYTVTDADPWKTICADFGTCSPGSLPSDPDGYWSFYVGSSCADWNTLFSNVSGVRFGLDLNGNPWEQHGYDNICFKPCADSNPCDSLMVMVDTISQMKPCTDASIITGNPCTTVYDPVCGCDGVTYSNGCVATENGITTYVAGECGTVETPDADACCYALDFNLKDSVVSKIVLKSPGKTKLNSVMVASGFVFSAAPSGREVTISPSSGGYMGEGLYDDLIKFCLALEENAPNPQTLVIQYYTTDANGEEVLYCQKGIQTHCQPPVTKEPCAEVTEATAPCSGNSSYDLSFDVKNISNPAFTASMVVITSLDPMISIRPDGTTLAPQASLAIPIASLTSGSSPISLDVDLISNSPLTANKNFCFEVTLAGVDMCCTTPDSTCVILEPCCDPCTESNITSKVISSSSQDSTCCHALDVEVACAENLFNQLALEVLTSGVNIGSHSTGSSLPSNWNIAQSTSSKVVWEHSSGAIPEGTYSDLINFCLDDIDTGETPQVLTLSWISVDPLSGDTSVTCIDTLTYDCEPPVNDSCLTVVDIIPHGSLCDTCFAEPLCNPWIIQHINTVSTTCNSTTGYYHVDFGTYNGNPVYVLEASLGFPHTMSTTVVSCTGDTLQHCFDSVVGELCNPNISIDPASDIVGRSRVWSCGNPVPVLSSTCTSSGNSNSIDYSIVVKNSSSDMHIASSLIVYPITPGVYYTPNPYTFSPPLQHNATQTVGMNLSGPAVIPGATLKFNLRLHDSSQPDDWCCFESDTLCIVIPTCDTTACFSLDSITSSVNSCKEVDCCSDPFCSPWIVNYINTLDSSCVPPSGVNLLKGKWKGECVFVSNRTYIDATRTTIYNCQGDTIQSCFHGPSVPIRSCEPDAGIDINIANDIDSLSLVWHCGDHIPTLSDSCMYSHDVDFNTNITNNNPCSADSIRLIAIDPVGAIITPSAIPVSLPSGGSAPLNFNVGGFLSGYSQIKVKAIMSGNCPDESSWMCMDTLALDMPMCPSDSCCMDKDEFLANVAAGFQVSNLGDCTYQVCANQFDTCHWFGSLMPDWGDGTITSPSLTQSDPPNNCWTHTYTTSGTYTISLFVQEGNPESCWDGMLTASVETDCNPCQGDPCEKTDITMVQDSTTDNCCYTVSIDNQYCKDYFKGLKVNTSGSTTVSQIQVLPGWSINQISTQSAEVYQTGLIPLGSQDVFTICANSSNSTTSFSVSWIHDNNGTDELLCPKNFEEACSSDNPSACVDIVDLNIDCDNVCFKLVNVSSPSFTIQSIHLSDLLPAGVSITPTSIAFPPLLAGDTSSVICIAYDGVAQGDDLCFGVTGHNIDITSGDFPTWCCTDTTSYCITVPPCCEGDPCEKTDVTMVQDSTTDNCCYTVSIDNQYCKDYFKGLKVNTSGSTTVSQIQVLPGWSINQISTQTAEVYQTGLIPLGSQDVFTICANSSNSTTSFSVSWIHDNNGTDELLCSKEFEESCSSDNPSACVDIVDLSIDCNNVCFKVVNVSSPSFTIQSIHLSNLLPTGVSITPTTIAFPPLMAGDTSSIICLAYDGVAQGDDLCFGVTGHNIDITSGDFPTWCCTDTTSYCITVPPCCEGDPCEKTDITMVQDSTTDNCCYTVSIDNQYCKDYFKGLKVNTSGSTTVSQIQVLPGWSINQISTQTAEVYQTGLIPLGSQDVFTICANSSNSTTSFSVSWIHDNNGTDELLCSKEFEESCSSDNPSACVDIVDLSIDCDNVCFKVVNVSSPSFTIQSIHLSDLLPAGVSITPTSIAFPPLMAGDTSSVICITYDGVAQGDDLCFGVTGHNIDITSGDFPTWCCTDTTSYCITVPPCCEGDPCEKTDITMVQDSTTDNCCYTVSIDNQYCKDYFKGLKVNTSGSTTVSQIQVLPGWSINQISTQSAEVYQTGLIPLGSQDVFTICANSSNSTTSFSVSWIHDNNGTDELLCPKDFEEACSSDNPSACVDIVDLSIDCDNVCFKVVNVSSPSFTIQSIHLSDLLPAGVSITPTAIAFPPLMAGDTSSVICITYDGVAQGDDLCFGVTGHNIDITSGDFPTWCCTDTTSYCITVPHCTQDCAAIDNIEVACVDDKGTYEMTFDLFNNTHLFGRGYDFESYALTKITTTGSAVMSSTHENLMPVLPSGQWQSGFTHRIQNAAPGDQICFTITGHDAKVDSSYTNCCSSDSTYCIVIPSFDDCICCDDYTIDSLKLDIDMALDSITQDSCTWCINGIFPECVTWEVDWGDETLSIVGSKNVCYGYEANSDINLCIKGFIMDANGNPCDSIIKCIDFNSGDCDVNRLVSCDPNNWLIPNGLTPNGDALNEELKMRKTNDCRIYLQVYNRWGQLVYTSNDYKMDWNGVNDFDQPLPDGTYYMRISTDYSRDGKVDRYITKFIDIRRE